jgi:hypothetical protein
VKLNCVLVNYRSICHVPFGTHNSLININDSLENSLANENMVVN